METNLNRDAASTQKYSFPKRPMHYFHADDDFRVDTEWGKENLSDFSHADRNTEGALMSSIA